MNAATSRNLTIAFFVLLAGAAISPMVAGPAKFPQWLEVVLGGLMSGVLYSLVALGLVLIFKASGVFNFAQGAMVLLAGLALVRSLDFLTQRGTPVWAAILLALLFAAVINAPLQDTRR